MSRPFFSFLPLFTEVRGIRILRTSPSGAYRKSGPAAPCSKARAPRVGRTAQNSTPTIYLSVVAAPPGLPIPWLRQPNWKETPCLHQ